MVKKVVSLVGYSDSDFASDLDSRRSLISYYVFQVVPLVGNLLYSLELHCVL